MSIWLQIYGNKRACTDYDKCTFYIVTLKRTTAKGRGVVWIVFSQTVKCRSICSLRMFALLIRVIVLMKIDFWSKHPGKNILRDKFLVIPEPKHWWIPDLYSSAWWTYHVNIGFDAYREIMVSVVKKKIVIKWRKL